MTPLEQLNQYLQDLHNLNMAYWLLQWDQNTHMPPGGGSARAAQMATLQRIRHERLTGDELGRLLDRAESQIDMSDRESFAASLIRVAQMDREDALALPSDFVADYARITAEAFEVWRRAKTNADYALFAPELQRILDLKLREAELRSGYEHPYDACLNRWEHGLTTAETRRIFDAHRQALVDLVAQVAEHEDYVDDSLLHQAFDVDAQRALSQHVSSALGFDYKEWATFDEAPHPFCLQIARNDVRLTTRFNPDFFNPAFYGTLHETGHGLHAHGFAEEIDGTFLSDMDSYSQAVCESQSRTWENLVGRSRAFCEWLFPVAMDYFPAQFRDFTPDVLYRAVNRVRPQFIRVEADELTYNLHIMLRFELELGLIEGRIPVAEAADAWNDTFHQYFGITPPDDAQGILQDIHWSMGGIGAFVGYALGNILAVQIYNEALVQIPEIPRQIGFGQFAPLREWLTEHVYQHGRKFTLAEMVQRITGGPLDSAPYVSYLRQKFTDVYNLS